MFSVKKKKNESTDLTWIRWYLYTCLYFIGFSFFSFFFVLFLSSIHNLWVITRVQLTHPHALYLIKLNKIVIYYSYLISVYAHNAFGFTWKCLIKHKETQSSYRLTQNAHMILLTYKRNNNRIRIFYYFLNRNYRYDCIRNKPRWLSVIIRMSNSNFFFQMNFINNL